MSVAVNRKFKVQVVELNQPEENAVSSLSTAKIIVTPQGASPRTIVATVSPRCKGYIKGGDLIGKEFNSTIYDPITKHNPFSIVSFLNKKNELINHRLELVFEYQSKKVEEVVMGVKTITYKSRNKAAKYFKRFDTVTV